MYDLYQLLEAYYSRVYLKLVSNKENCFIIQQILYTVCKDMLTYQSINC